jgi:hypothetical protein
MLVILIFHTGMNEIHVVAEILFFVIQIMTKQNSAATIVLINKK